MLKGVVRVENLEDATEHIADVLARVKPEYLVRVLCAIDTFVQTLLSTIRFDMSISGNH